MDEIYGALQQLPDLAAQIGPIVDAAVKEPVTYALAGAAVLYALVRRTRKQADKG